MTYAKAADLTARFGERELTQLTDRDDTGQTNVGLVNRALQDATAFIDSYIGRVYALPLRGCAKPVVVPGAAPEYVPPPVLTRLACDLARYYLYTDLADDHEAARRYKNAVRDLADIASGKTQLTCPWGGPPGDALHAEGLQSQEVQSSFAPRQITDDSLRGYA
ncbi:MAG: gp436 family protein [Burkholderiaceae bacterium]